MRSAWFDTFSLQDLTERQDLQLPGLTDGIKYLKEIVEKEVQRLDGNARKVFLGGFSQGSAIALWSLFTGAATIAGRLGGFVGLSAWMPFTREAMETVTAAAKRDSLTGKAVDPTGGFLGIVGLKSFGVGIAQLSDMPVFLGHGIDDSLVSVKSCRELTSIFRGLGCDVVAHEYLGAERDGHWVKEPEEASDLVEYLKRHMQEV